MGRMIELFQIAHKKKRISEEIRFLFPCGVWSGKIISLL